VRFWDFFTPRVLRDEGIRGVMKGAGNRWKVEEDFQFFHLPPSTCPLLLALG